MRPNVCYLKVTDYCLSTLVLCTQFQNKLTFILFPQNDEKMFSCLIKTGGPILNSLLSCFL